MRPGIPLACCAAALLAMACDRHDEPPPPETTQAPQPMAAPSNPALLHHLPPRVPKGPPVPDNAASGMLPSANRDPDWGLDPADPARDYVARYLKVAKRYGDSSGCVALSKSTFTGDKSTVEARNDAGGACGKPNDLRDRFLVSVANDRMTLDPSLGRPPLAKWPDGSDADGPPARTADIQDLRKWLAPLHEAFHALELAPLRVQLYGRGTYPVISIAGWHGPVTREMSPEQLAGPAKALCQANGGAPLGIIAGLDRSTLLRIDCPASARFESL